MRVLCPSSELRCVPMRIVDSESGGAGLLGGAPPKAVKPDGADSLRYFASVPFTEDPTQQLSIFVADYGRLVNVRGTLNELGLLDIVVHPPTLRNHEATDLKSGLSSHGIQVLLEVDDWIRDEDGTLVVRSGHKLGGRPHLVRETELLSAAIEKIGAEGFVHIAQFDFPESEDATVSGNWPFGDGIFSLFGRTPFERHDWRWCWDF